MQQVGPRHYKYARKNQPPSHKLGPCNASCEYRRTGTIVRFSSQSDLATHKTLLASHNVDFWNNERTTKFVIKGLSPAFNPRDIQSELVESGFEVLEVTNMVSWITKRPLPCLSSYWRVKLLANASRM